MLLCCACQPTALFRSDTLRFSWKSELATADDVNMLYSLHLGNDGVGGGMWNDGSTGGSCVPDALVIGQGLHDLMLANLDFNHGHSSPPRDQPNTFPHSGSSWCYGSSGYSLEEYMSTLAVKVVWLRRILGTVYPHPNRVFWRLTNEMSKGIPDLIPIVADFNKRVRVALAGSGFNIIPMDYYTSNFYKVRVPSRERRGKCAVPRTATHIHSLRHERARKYV